MDRSALEQQQRINAIRAITKPSRVRLHHSPRWLLKLMRDKLRSLGNRLQPCSNAWTLCQSLDIDPHFLDHWGSTDNGETFVSEPYLGPRDISAAMTFAESLGLDIEISAVSEWNPPSTIRLSFTRKKETKHG